MKFDEIQDTRVRRAAFDWLARKVSIHDGVNGVIPYAVLKEGFELDQRNVRVMNRRQGIFKPASMQLPLSIKTSPKRTYDDAIDRNNILRYRYRGTDPEHPDNAGLRFAMQRRLPLIYFHGIVPGKYLAMWPVHVIDDAPKALTFSIAIDDASPMNFDSQSRQDHLGIAESPRREYAHSWVRRRLHQAKFRERVLRAYRSQCAFCRLRHAELLDAAHIIADSELEGEPVVPNGISLCRLHHAAFDKLFVAVRPDRTIEVRPDILKESDGPTLKHAIQGLHGQPILLPKQVADQPAIEFLAQRYNQFLEAVADTR